MRAISRHRTRQLLNRYLLPGTRTSEDEGSASSVTGGDGARSPRSSFGCIRTWRLHPLTVRIRAGQKGGPKNGAHRFFVPASDIAAHSGDCWQRDPKYSALRFTSE